MHRVPQIPPSRLIRINSRFKEFGGTNSKFQYSFGQNRLVDSVYQIALVTASLPKTYTNIYEPINELSWTVAGLLWNALLVFWCWEKTTTTGERCVHFICTLFFLISISTTEK